MKKRVAPAGALGVALLASPSAMAQVLSDVPPDTVWTMHQIVPGTPGSGEYAGSDGVDLADINGDGLLAVVSGYEQGHRVSVSLHPGDTAVTQPWPTVKLPSETERILGPEDAVFADVDDDGAMDVIIGAEADRRVTVMFAPTDPTADLLNAENWTRVDLSASLAENMSTMRVQWADMDNDGAEDILVGGKEGSSIDRDASLGYYTSTDPRDGGSWDYHEITPVGWVMEMQAVDMNGDDKLDVVYSDRDRIDHPELDLTKRGLRWMENSGGPDPTWEPHPISPVEGLHKWFTLVNWDNDNDMDLVDCRSDTNINESSIWLNDGNALSWTEVVVPIPANVGWCQHATVDDVDGDGGLDLGYSYSHADGLSGVVWLKNTGTPGAPSWERHEVSGTAFGIKYDNLIWHDLDHDGDFDALTSEQHDPDMGPGLGVIWYKNPEIP